ncbi:MAG: hypothetical protein ABIJ45_02205 [Candidatus Zixiibacteriota bacterium]
MRAVSILSAVIAKGEYALTREIITVLMKRGVEKTAIYETILQSYLFLGFPRMIEAALAFNECYGDFEYPEPITAVTENESQKWFDEGVKLCRRVYGRNYDKLEKRFLAVSPDLFRWMVFEGYGKVLSRNGLNNIERELAEVAALIVDMRERQLMSHILGSLNVGAELDLIKLVLEDITPVAGKEGHELGEKVLARIVDRYETEK